MQLEKEKKEKRERERCRALAQRIAEEANPASAALLGEQMSQLTEALHRAGVEAEEWTEGSEAELLVVADPAWETLPETLPARVLLVSDESTVMAGWAEQLAQRGYFRDFGWRSKGRAQQSALFCTSQPTPLCRSRRRQGRGCGGAEPPPAGGRYGILPQRAAGRDRPLPAAAYPSEQMFQTSMTSPCGWQCQTEISPLS